MIQTLIKKLKGQNEGQKMDTLIALRTALSSWAAVPRDQVTVGEESVPGASRTGHQWCWLGVKLGRGYLAPSSDSGGRCPCGVPCGIGCLDRITGVAPELVIPPLKSQLSELSFVLL